MKRLTLLLTLVFLTSCRKEQNESRDPDRITDKPVSEQLGKKLFEGKGNCVACHQPEQKVIGPSIQQIAQVYKDKNANIVDFLQEKSKPLVDPEQYAVMKTNFAITKAMSNEELQALEAYIYSFNK